MEPGQPCSRPLAASRLPAQQRQPTSSPFSFFPRTVHRLKFFHRHNVEVGSPSIRMNKMLPFIYHENLKEFIQIWNCVHMQTLLCAWAFTRVRAWVHVYSTRTSARRFASSQKQFFRSRHNAEVWCSRLHHAWLRNSHANVNFCIHTSTQTFKLSCVHWHSRICVRGYMYAAHQPQRGRCSRSWPFSPPARRPFLPQPVAWVATASTVLHPIQVHDVLASRTHCAVASASKRRAFATRRRGAIGMAWTGICMTILSHNEVCTFTHKPSTPTRVCECDCASGVCVCVCVNAWVCVYDQLWCLAQAGCRLRSWAV